MTILRYVGVLEWDICELRRANNIEKPYVLLLFLRYVGVPG
jgi:hypothetical protein